jgi:hypothetical protein
MAIRTESFTPQPEATTPGVEKNARGSLRLYSSLVLGAGAVLAIFGRDAGPVYAQSELTQSSPPETRLLEGTLTGVSNLSTILYQDSEGSAKEPTPEDKLLKGVLTGVNELLTKMQQPGENPAWDVLPSDEPVKPITEQEVPQDEDQEIRERRGQPVSRDLRDLRGRPL